MAESSNRTVLTRREALILSATAGVGIAARVGFCSPCGLYSSFMPFSSARCISRCAAFATAESRIVYSTPAFTCTDVALPWYSTVASGDELGAIPVPCPSRTTTA